MAGSRRGWTTTYGGQRRETARTSWPALSPHADDGAPCQYGAACRVPEHQRRAGRQAQRRWDAYVAFLRELHTPVSDPAFLCCVSVDVVRMVCCWQVAPNSSSVIVQVSFHLWEKGRNTVWNASWNVNQW